MGRVAQLWRYPVKSLGGQQVDRSVLVGRGVRDDRLWAVRDLTTDVTATARRLPRLLGCTARYDGEPDGAVGPGRAWPVVITTPDGEEVHSDDRGVHDALSEVAGRAVRLTPLPARGDRRAHRAGWQSPASVQRDLGLDGADRLPRRPALPLRAVAGLAVHSTPPGAFHDVFAVHLISTTTLDTLAEADPAAGVDVRRFRPTVVLELDDEVLAGLVPDADPGLPEHAWSGADLLLGGARLRVVTPTVRCVVPSRAQPGLDRDVAVTRAVARRGDRFAGAYAEVRGSGDVAVGDAVGLVPAGPPGRVRRARDRAVGTALREGLRLGAAVQQRLG
ncbi:MOSC domain-containing protein [Rhodococcus aerolatus]